MNLDRIIRGRAVDAPTCRNCSAEFVGPTTRCPLCGSTQLVLIQGGNP